MGNPKIGTHPEIYLKIEGEDVSRMFSKFEWKAFTNGGYVIRAKLEDPYWNILRNLTTKYYLRKGRKQPTKAIFEIKWPGVPDGSTGKQVAYLTDLDARGYSTGTPGVGGLEFIAIDPPSYWLNAGDSSGKIYKGKVSDVIKKVLEEYYKAPNGEGQVDVSTTTDSDQNIWHMNRMDPKTFIGSLLDWSSSVTEQKTNWVVSSDGDVERGQSISIKEQAKKEQVNYGVYILDTSIPSGVDSYYFEFLADNFISLFQRSLITHGISAVSERFLDRKVDQEKKMVHVTDENTSAKLKPSISADRGFTKPGDSPPSPEDPHQWSTAIMAIPEHSAGDIGQPYDKYIDGRARYQFLNMLNLVMRIRLRVTGEPSRDLANGHNLGVSRLKIAWMDADGNPYFLSGTWFVYGFHHIVTREAWHTDLYCARMDHDANATAVGGG